MPVEKSNSLASESNDNHDNKVYTPIDPSYVRKGVEDILRISELIRLQQNSIIAALNYVGPPSYRQYPPVPGSNRKMSSPISMDLTQAKATTGAIATNGNGDLNAATMSKSTVEIQGPPSAFHGLSTTANGTDLVVHGAPPIAANTNACTINGNGIPHTRPMIESSGKLYTHLEENHPRYRTQAPSTEFMGAIGTRKTEKPMEMASNSTFSQNASVNLSKTTPGTNSSIPTGELVDPGPVQKPSSSNPDASRVTFAPPRLKVALANYLAKNDLSYKDTSLKPGSNSLPSKRTICDINDEFLRLLSLLATKKLRRNNAPLPLLVSDWPALNQSSNAPFCSPSKHAYPFPPGYDPYTPRGMPIHPSCPVKLPPLSSTMQKKGDVASTAPASAASPLNNVAGAIPKSQHRLAVTSKHPGSIPTASTVLHRNGEYATRSTELNKKSNSHSNGSGEEIISLILSTVTGLNRNESPITVKASKNQTVDVMSIKPGAQKGQKSFSTHAGVGVNSADADENDTFYDARTSISPDSSDPNENTVTGKFQNTLEFSKGKPVYPGLHSGITVLRDQPGFVNSVSTKSIPSNQPMGNYSETMVKPGKKKPVMDVFVNDLVKVAPMISQPPSAQLCYLAETPLTPEEPEERKEPMAQVVTVPPTNFPPRPQPTLPGIEQKHSNSLKGKFILNDSDVFNFMIYNSSSENSKKNFLAICETVWDKFHAVKPKK